MIQRAIASANRSKNPAPENPDSTPERAPSPIEVAVPPTRVRRAPNESRVPAGIPGARRRAPAGKRHLVPMAIAALLAVPLWASAGEGDRDRDDDKDRAAKSFNDLARKYRQDDSDSWRDSWRGEPSLSGWKSESDDDDVKDEKSRRWPHEGNGHTSVIPEPATAALLLGGLAAVGFVVHRRRRTD